MIKYFIWILIFITGLNAESHYDKIKSLLTESRHQTPEEIRDLILEFDRHPESSLMKILDEDGHRVYVKSRALEILGMISKDDTTKNFLKKKIEDPKEHPALRLSAYDGFVKGNTIAGAKTSHPEIQRWSRDPLFHGRDVQIIESSRQKFEKHPKEIQKELTKKYH